MLNKIEDRKYLFLGKRENDDRDACVYIDTKSVSFDCGHYFGGIHFTGACFSGFEDEVIEDMTNGKFKTILTLNEFKELISLKEEIKSLGYSIVVGDERYIKGLELQKRFKEFLEKLKTNRAEELFQEIIKEEKEYCMEEYDLDEKEVDEVFDNYYLDYQDRAIINCVYRNIEEFGEEMFTAYNCEIEHDIRKYVDFEAYGQDLVDDSEDYLELSDGRIVSLSY